MPINVAIVCSEAVPYAKTGGLADVIGGLAPSLKRLGCGVSFFMPLYAETAKKSSAFIDTGIDITVPIDGHAVHGRIFKDPNAVYDVYFIKCDEYYERSRLYGTNDGDYFDNLERFSFLSRGSLLAMKALGIKPDVIHCNDWQTALIPAYLNDTYKNDGWFKGTATVLTIHNIAFQGIFPSGTFALTGLSPAVYSPEGAEFWGSVNLLKAGLVYADVLTTVSQTYSEEIKTPEFGCGLEGVLVSRANDLFGILNGVDYAEWNPSNDRLIPAKYSIDDLKGKAACRKRLIKEFGLKLGADTLLIGIVSRLTEQKGFNIIMEALPELMRHDIAIVILGSGDAAYQRLVTEAIGRYPERAAIKLAFDNALAHLIEAGSDAFLMASRFEPCGLNQMYSLKYGTVPIVRATGGLDDTVKNCGEHGANGFKFKDYTADAMAGKVAEAVEVFKDKKGWLSLQKTGMQEDFSWKTTAQKYIDAYNLAIRRCLKNRQTVTKNGQ